MSSDDALFVQKTDEGKWAVQYGPRFAPPPSVDQATREEIFSTLDEAINTMAEIAGKTEYGFEFPNPQDFGIPVVSEGVWGG